jgi:hypothetical protein
MLVFAVLLLTGVALASRAVTRGRWFEAGLVFLWALAALRSARHIPLYAVASAPVIASECGAWCAAIAARSSARSAARIFWDLGQGFARSRRFSIWAPVFGAAALSVTLVPAALRDFPEGHFPVDAVSRHLGRLPAARILTSDQWADYLIYRLYPNQRVFIDGRSDFYGPALGTDYHALLTAGRHWPELLAEYRFDLALIPVEWPLATLLEGDPGWHLVDRDSVAEVLVRTNGLKTTGDRVDATKGGP